MTTCDRYRCRALATKRCAVTYIDDGHHPISAVTWQCASHADELINNKSIATSVSSVLPIPIDPRLFW